MITQFLLTTLPTVMTVLGCVVAAAGLLSLVVSAISSRALNPRSSAAVSGGLAAVLVAIWWNEVLAFGFRIISVDVDAPAAVATSGDAGADLVLAAQVACVTLLAIALVTGLFAVGLHLIVRTLLAPRRPAPAPAPIPVHTPPAPATEMPPRV